MSIPTGKRMLALALVIISLLLVACGGDDDDAATTGTPTASATPEAEDDDGDEPDEEETTPALTVTPLASTAAAATAAAATAATEPAGLTGTWSGAYVSTSDPGATGTFVLEWEQTGSVLNGTINVANSECVSLGIITGSVDGSQITFGAVEGTFSIAYEGTVTGDEMAGTYSSPPCGGAAGTWTASRQ